MAEHAHSHTETREDDPAERVEALVDDPEDDSDTISEGVREMEERTRLASATARIME